MHALLIDIGNTSLKIGVAGIEGLVASYTLPTDCLLYTSDAADE